MKEVTCVTSNVERLKKAYKKLEETPTGIERMALVWGESGLGKTTAIHHMIANSNGLYMQATPLWTPNVFLKNLAVETNQEPSNRNQDMLDSIQRSLRINPRTLFIDEADTLFAVKNTTRLLETIRALYDMSHSPVVLIGMDMITKKIARWPQLNRRITQVVEFLPSTVEDCKLLATQRCEVPVADDLLEALYRASGGNAGYFTNGLTSIEEVGRRLPAGETMTLADWQASGEKTFFLDRRI